MGLDPASYMNTPSTSRCSCSSSPIFFYLHTRDPRIVALNLHQLGVNPVFHILMLQQLFGRHICLRDRLGGDPMYGGGKFSQKLGLLYRLCGNAHHRHRTFHIKCPVTSGTVAHSYP
mmetsp:Transcript_34671/g.80179  ORF Transcript_34671/g.80179 Transcript_34671/m.80179 type:complete len:117 (-) Transcript_34671:8-358(-)